MSVFSELEKEEQQEIMARVKRGAKLLDQKKPGWVNKIRVTKLDMQNCDECVLGQVYGDFNDGCHIIGVSGRTEDDIGNWATHGFDVCDADNTYRLYFRVEREYAALGDAWTKLIKARKAKAKK